MHTEPNWRDETRQMLIDRPASIKTAEVAKAIGVSVDWVCKFAQGKIDNPGVMTVHALNTFLKSKARR